MPATNVVLEYIKNIRYLNSILFITVSFVHKHVIIVRVPEDSEPLFGLWFESTLVAPDAAEAAAARAANDANDNSDEPPRPNAIVPDKAEPYSVFFMEL